MMIEWKVQTYQARSIHSSNIGGDFVIMTRTPLYHAELSLSDVGLEKSKKEYFWIAAV
jgi:hypothetical protein